MTGRVAAVILFTLVMPATADQMTANKNLRRDMLAKMVNKVVGKVTNKVIGKSLPIGYLAHISKERKSIKPSAFQQHHQAYHGSHHGHGGDAGRGGALGWGGFRWVSRGTSSMSATVNGHGGGDRGHRRDKDGGDVGTGDAGGGKSGGAGGGDGKGGKKVGSADEDDDEDNDKGDDETEEGLTPRLPWYRLAWTPYNILWAICIALCLIFDVLDGIVMVIMGELGHEDYVGLSGHSPKDLGVKTHLQIQQGECPEYYGLPPGSDVPGHPARKALTDSPWGMAHRNSLQRQAEEKADREDDAVLLQPETMQMIAPERSSIGTAVGLEIPSVEFLTCTAALIVLVAGSKLTFTMLQLRRSASTRMLLS